MRTTILLLLMLVFHINLYADWYEIDAFNRVPAFSKIAKTGKVSIFVISTPWCAPCHLLKDALKDQNFNMSEVDIYIVNMATSGINNTQLKKTEAYNIWMSIENLKSWPTIYITSQTTNIKAIFNDKGSDKDMISRIVRITNDLLDQNKYFNGELVYFNEPQTNAKYNSQSVTIAVQYSDTIIVYKNLISELKSTLVSKNNEIYKNEIDLQNALNTLKLREEEIVRLKSSVTELGGAIREKKDSIVFLSNKIETIKTDQFNSSNAFLLLQSLKVTNNGTKFYKFSKSKEKTTRNHKKVIFIRDTLNVKFQSNKTNENFIIKIKNLMDSSYLLIDNNYEKDLMFTNGRNPINLYIDFRTQNSKYYQIELYKFDILVFREELNFKY